MRSPFALLLLAVAPLAHAVEPLRLPPAVAFPQVVDTVRVSAALVAACTHQKWVVEKDTGEAVTAFRTQRALRLHMQIDYDGRGITYHYLDSDNFHGQDDDNGGVLIHRKANAWLEALGDEVMLELQPVLFEREPATVVPVLPEPAQPEPRERPAERPVGG